MVSPTAKRKHTAAETHSAEKRQKKKEEEDASRDTAKLDKGTASEDDILRYLLLDSTLDSITPPEILKEEGEKKDEVIYPHSDLSPFCALVSASLLSKPFSHRLGMRAIHVLLNPPYRLHTPRAISEDCSGEEIWQALADAHTLHKEKTKGQLIDLSNAIKQDYPDDYETSDLVQFHARAEGNLETLRAQVARIKGFGEKTTDLFFRRVQLHWSELFPFADTLALDAAVALGLQVDSADNLLARLRSHLGDHVDGIELRRTFIRLLEVLICKKLDKELDATREEAERVGKREGDADKQVQDDHVGEKDETES